MLTKHFLQYFFWDEKQPKISSDQSTHLYLICHLYTAMFLLNVGIFLPVPVTVGIVQEKCIKRLPRSHQVVL